MKKNFAGTTDNQLESFNYLTTLTGKDLTTDITPNNEIFTKKPNFIDNCKNCNMDNNTTFKNADGEYTSSEYDSSGAGGIFGTGITGGQIFTGALDYLTNEQKQQQLEETRRIEEERRRQAEAEAKAKQAEAKSIPEKIKAYGLPIAITGGVIIIGIAAYFFFKKKKIN